MKPMMEKMPDPKAIVDSIGDGAIELAEAPVRAAENVASSARSFATNVRSNMEDFKRRMPDDLSAIPDCAVKAVSHTFSDGIGLFEGIGSAARETVNGVKSQVRRATG